mmetsp:Transcript_35711/g.43087  ORF Transcript_35711/g.43087 Transcript_35711/m.43087 type:complete len:114 (+) Transcript_35711:48-389(+)
MAARQSPVIVSRAVYGLRRSVAYPVRETACLREYSSGASPAERRSDHTCSTGCTHPSHGRSSTPTATHPTSNVRTSNTFGFSGKQYAANWDRIFGKKKQEKGKETGEEFEAKE